MTKGINWENRIGRRLRLRDLHVFFAALQCGSMGKAAAQLGVSQPTVSETVADLEHTLGVRLFDRSPQGIEPTVYGHALYKRAMAAFDELKLGIRDIEFLADPTVGELTIGCPESIAAALLPQIIKQFHRQYPRVVLNVEHSVTPTLELPMLRARSLDFALARLNKPVTADHLGDDLTVDVLFEDQLVIAAGIHSPWGRRHRIDLAELINEPWILPPPGTWNTIVVAEAFRACGLEMPKTSLITFSVHLRMHLLADGAFITAVPNSVLRLNAERFLLKVLPVDLPLRPWPIAIVTIKNRTLSAVAQRFIECAREVAKSIAARPQTRKS